ncbi:2-amino-4-hydroxy-6-hydroxymethyldihydropteridine diphosphokinase [Kocuria coralli]|uniref:2-amino-4-hydroxy-6-hydroxymethyldihydropteridine diphosphokinase n=1 Tax=Kocuria coralli TaxID=1461025 RepID=A0A5J5KXV5_9MICC|nr:2-amino-4-hydroxy-6-hydroxymethyldihydropteridine diphosphokinase [Kocuria coralli]KAA9394130.1 2-amino-4-hydroxy-6-hydroxymethyldihydropteridine diphosphokinase [Kocuria coralli]
MRHAIIALGSNLGDRAELLRAALGDLRAAEGVEVLDASPVVVTRPVGGPEGQPDFLNAVVKIRTTLGPFEMLQLCQAIEDAHDRTHDIEWGPRTVDLDIIDFGGLSMDEPTLTLPHPRAAGRAFVLVPWAMMDPEARLGGRRVRELAQEADDLPGISPRTHPPLIDPSELPHHDGGGRVPEGLRPWLQPPAERP